MPDPLLDSFRTRLAREVGPALWADLERAVLERRDLTTGHAEWGLLAEDAGLLNLAFREFQLILYVAVLYDDNAAPRARAALDRAVAAGLPAQRAAALGRDAGRDQPDDDAEHAALRKTLIAAKRLHAE